MRHSETNQLIRWLTRVSTLVLLALIFAVPATANVQFQLELPGENALHFSTVDGAAILVPPGLYGVELGDGNTFVLTPEKGEGLTIIAYPTVHDEQLFATSLLAEQTSPDEVHILLLFEGGKGLDAVGSYSGVRSRAASWSQVLRAKRIMRAKRIARAKKIAQQRAWARRAKGSRPARATNIVSVNNALLYQRLSISTASLNPCAVSNPVGSNRKIVFGRGSFEEKRESFRMNPDGSEVARFTNYTRGQPNSPLVTQGAANMSPDGTKIAFTMFKSEGNPPISWSHIYTIKINGTDPVQVSQGDRPHDNNPSWSPDGTKLVFVRGIGASSNLFTMNANGSNVTQLLNFPGWQAHPQYSPDGTKILFDSGGDIYVMMADGSPGRVNLTNDAAGAYWGKWCPTGAKITFTSARDGDREIYIMNADGSGRTQLTNNDIWDGGASWSPDGRKIVFHRTPATLDPDPIEGIYLMNPDGSGVQHIYQSPMVRGGYSMYPTW